VPSRSSWTKSKTSKSVFFCRSRSLFNWLNRISNFSLHTKAQILNIRPNYGNYYLNLFRRRISAVGSTVCSKQSICPKMIKCHFSQYEVVLFNEEIHTYTHYTCTGWAKKVSQRNLHITSSNTGRFSKFLHYNILQEICNKQSWNIPPHLNCVATLTCEIFTS